MSWVPPFIHQMDQPLTRTPQSASIPSWFTGMSQRVYHEEQLPARASLTINHVEVIDIDDTSDDELPPRKKRIVEWPTSDDHYIIDAKPECNTPSSSPNLRTSFFTDNKAIVDSTHPFITHEGIAQPFTTTITSSCLRNLSIELPTAGFVSAVNLSNTYSWNCELTSLIDLDSEDIFHTPIPMSALHQPLFKPFFEEETFADEEEMDKIKIEELDAMSQRDSLRKQQRILQKDAERKESARLREIARQKRIDHLAACLTEISNRDSVASEICHMSGGDVNRDEGLSRSSSKSSLEHEKPPVSLNKPQSLNNWAALMVGKPQSQLEIGDQPSRGRTTKITTDEPYDSARLYVSPDLVRSGPFSKVNRLSYNPFRGSDPKKKVVAKPNSTQGALSRKTAKASRVLSASSKNELPCGPITLFDVQLHLETQRRVSYVEIHQKLQPSEDLDYMMKREREVSDVFAKCGATIELLENAAHGEGDALLQLNGMAGPFLSSPKEISTSRRPRGRPKTIVASKLDAAETQIPPPPSSSDPDERPTVSGKSINWQTFHAYMRPQDDVETAAEQSVREESPLCDADLCFNVYQVQRRQLTSEQLADEVTLEDVPWIDFGPCFENAGDADAYVTILATQNQYKTQKILDPDGSFSVRFGRDGHDRRQATLSSEAGIIECRVQTILRTYHDGVTPKSKRSWQPKIGYFVILKTVTRHTIVASSIPIEEIPCNQIELTDEDFEKLCGIESAFSPDPPPHMTHAVSTEEDTDANKGLKGGFRTPSQIIADDTANAVPQESGNDKTEAEHSNDDLFGDGESIARDGEADGLNAGDEEERVSNVDESSREPYRTEQQSMGIPDAHKLKPEPEVVRESVRETIVDNTMFTNLALANEFAIKTFVDASFTSTSINLLQRDLDRSEKIEEVTRKFEEDRRDELVTFEGTVTADDRAITVLVQRGRIQGPRNL